MARRDSIIKVKVVGDLSQINKAMTVGERRVAKFSTAMSKLRVPVLLAGAASFKLASDFDSSMSKITGLVGIAAREAKFDVAPMVMGFILGRELEYSFGQTLALAGDHWIRFALTERLGMTAVVLATPVIGLLLGRRMAFFRARALEREGGMR